MPKSKETLKLSGIKSVMLEQVERDLKEEKSKSSARIQ